MVYTWFLVYLLNPYRTECFVAVEGDANDVVKPDDDDTTQHTTRQMELGFK